MVVRSGGSPERAGRNPDLAASSWNSGQSTELPSKESSNERRDMRAHINHRTRAISLVSSVLAVVVVAGCGSSSSSTPAEKPSAVVTASVAANRGPAVRLRIVSPHAGAHTGRTVEVVVAATGSVRLSGRSLRYVLDRRAAHLGGRHFVLRNLGPGRHHLTVRLSDDPSVRASTSFVVRVPARHPASTAAPVPPAQPQTITSTTAQTSATAAPSAPTTTVAPPKVLPPPTPTTTTTTSAPPPSGGIPQGNGGDGDADNNGGPTDGDGNI